MNDITKVPPVLLMIIPILLLSQAAWIYCDASKRGENKWLWGLFGLLNVPSNLIIYLLVTRRFKKRNKCNGCGHNVDSIFLFCPY